MAVYFYKLFDKIAELNITQKELMQRIGSSSATLAKMRNNQSVSLDVIVRICDELKCDIGDVVTCIPQQTDVDVKNNNYDRLNSITRTVLNEYMDLNGLSVGDVARITSLSINTVKSFINGNNMSAASHAKLLRLGEQYNQSLGKSFGDLMPTKKKKIIYCYSCGKRGNRCWAAQSLWNAEKNEFEHYCAFGFEQAFDENKKLFATQECPHPTTGKEFTKAREQYEFMLKGEYEYIPAKGEKV